MAPSFITFEGTMLQIPTKTNYSNTLRKRRTIYNKLEDRWRSTPIGQRLVHLQYAIYTIEGLKILLDIQNKQESVLKRTEAELLDAFCRSNSISPTQFKETYDIRQDMTRKQTHVGVFKIVLKEDIDQRIGEVREQLNAQMQAAIENGQTSGVLAVDTDGMSQECLMERPVEDVGIAFEPFELFCRAVIPRHIFEQVEFASRFIPFEPSSFHVAFLSSTVFLETLSNFMVVVPFGNKYLVEIGAW